MTDSVELKADCSRCAALCCVALAFDKSDKFAIDKPAGTACPNLDSAHGCAIHADLNQNGFSGCVQYDCLGAGQRVTQDLFEGQSWRDDPDLLAPMMGAFSSMRRVHELLQLLMSASALSLTAQQMNTHGQLLAVLQPTPEWDLESLQAFDRSDIARDVYEFLGSLKEQAASLRLPPRR